MGIAVHSDGTAVFHAGGEQGFHVGQSVPAHPKGIAVQFHNLVMLCKQSGQFLIIITVVLLLGMADAVHIWVLRHAMPEPVRLLAGERAGNAGTVDGSHHPVHVSEHFLRNIQPAENIHHVGLHAVQHGNAVNAAGQDVPVSKMPDVRCVRHGRSVIRDRQCPVAAGFGRGRHLVQRLIGVGGTTGMCVQISDQLHDVDSSFVS